MKILRPSWPNKTSFPQTKDVKFLAKVGPYCLFILSGQITLETCFNLSSVQFLVSYVSLLFYFYERASKSVYPHCLGFHLPSVNWFLSFPIPNECLIVYMAAFALCLCV